MVRLDGREVLRSYRSKVIRLLNLKVGRFDENIKTHETETSNAE